MPVSKRDFDDVLRGLNIEMELLGLPPVPLLGKAGKAVRSSIYNWMKNNHARKSVEVVDMPVYDDIRKYVDEWLLQLEMDYGNHNDIRGFIPIREILNMFDVPISGKTVDPRHKKAYIDACDTLRKCGWSYTDTPIRLRYKTYRGYLKMPKEGDEVLIWMYVGDGKWEGTPLHKINR